MEDKNVVDLAMDAGKIMLESGAETYRVEDTIKRIVEAGGSKEPQIFATTTGIFSGVTDKDGTTKTSIKRISNRSLNFEKIAKVNSLSRNFCSGKLMLSQAFEELENIKNLKHFKYPIVILSYGFICGAYAPMFDGSYKDAFCAFIIGIFLGLWVTFLNKKDVSYFLVNMLGSMLISMFSVILVWLNFDINYEKIIIGCIMPLVPGVAITNAVRDVMAGDFVSGTARIVEAVIIAVAIAGGVGIILKLSEFLKGIFL